MSVWIQNIVHQNSTISSLLDSLRVYYTLDEGSGDFVDYVNSYNLSVTGSPIRTAGKINNCVNFNNGANYLERANGNNFSPGNAEISLSMWINFNNLPSVTGHRSRIFGVYSVVDTSWFSSVMIQTDMSTNRLMFWITSTAPNNDVVYSDVIPSAGVWYHYVFISRIGDICIYRNNSDVSYGKSLSRSTNITPSTSWGRFGLSHSSYYADLLLDEVAIWDRFLDVSEIDYLFNSENGRSVPFN